MYKTADTDGGSGFVIKKDNSLWVWGHNACGECGNRTKETIYTQEKVMEDVKAVKSAGSSGCTLILKTDNSLWGWGRNNFGILGSEPTEHSEVQLEPVKIADDVKMIKAMCGDGCNYVRTDGVLCRWSGLVKYGRLEYCTNDGWWKGQEGFSEPEKLIKDVAFIGSGANFIKEDGTLWTFGDSTTELLLDATMFDEYGRLLDKQVQVMEDIKIQ